MPSQKTHSHETMVQRLAKGSFDLLEIKRVDAYCYLLLHLDGQMGIVFKGKDGSPKNTGI